MTYSVAVTNSFRKDERKLDSKTRTRMYRTIAQIAEDPYSYKELQGQLKNLRSARFGDFRIIYRINTQQNIVELIAVGLRQRILNQD